jgi:hypothetical protein
VRVAHGVVAISAPISRAKRAVWSGEAEEGADGENDEKRARFVSYKEEEKR